MSFSADEVNEALPLATRSRTVNDDGRDCFIDGRGNITSGGRSKPARPERGPTARCVPAAPISSSCAGGVRLARVNTRIVFVALAATGCAPSLATMQPARVGPQGSVQVTAAMEVAIPTGTISRTLDVATTISDRALNGDPISEADRQQLFTAAVNVLASPPSLSPLFAVAYAVRDRIEVGLRYAGQGWRLGARYQPLRHEDGPFDLVVGAGVARSAYKIPLAEFISVLEVDDFTRWTIDVPVTVGASRSWFRTWIGPKLVYSRFDTAVRLVIPNEVPEVVSFDGHSTFIGGVGGVALGYRNLFFGIELTVGRLSGSTATALSTAGVLRSADVGGTVVYPAFGLMGEI
jgi:hypothetical protein